MNEEEIIKKRVKELEGDLEKLILLRTTLEGHPEHLKNSYIEEAYDSVVRRIEMTQSQLEVNKEKLAWFEEGDISDGSTDFHKGYLSGLRESAAYLESYGRGRALTVICQNIRTVSRLLETKKEKQQAASKKIIYVDVSVATDRSLILARRMTFDEFMEEYGGN